MTLEQIISLTQAGFTKDDIFAMIDSDINPHQPVVSPQPPAAAPAVPAPAVVPQQALAPAQAPVPAPVMGTAQMPASAPAMGTAPVYVPQQVPTPTPAPAPTPTPAPTPSSAWGFAPAPVPEHVPAQVPIQVPQQVPQQVPTWGAQGVVQPMSENDKMINRLMESMNSLNSTMQKSNLMADVQPKAATTDDMLAAIINPPTLKEVN